jgi:hypothetical protein
MQCLFCGKELALLKRLRGGGEFCSEAHRKEYQEQYEQLALARLIQAKPPAEPAAPLGRTSSLVPAAPSVRVPESLQLHEAPPARRPAQLDAPGARAMSEAQDRVPGMKPAEDAGPAPLAGFVGSILVPAVAAFQHAQPMELDRKTTPAPSLPVATASEAGPHRNLPPAASVDWETSLQALDYNTRKNELGMEARGFVGTTPFLEMHLQPGTAPEPAGAADVMEIFMSPHPPQNATPWLGPPREFPLTPAELGQLARLDFSTTGVAYSDLTVAGDSSALHAKVLAEQPLQIDEPSPSEPPPAQSAPAEPVPEMVTQTLPVTLHGLAAGRGKFAQTFTAAIVAPADVQIPPSAVLPLRPAIVFLPARVPATIQAPVPATPAPASVQPAPAQSKAAPLKTEGRGRTSVIPAPKPAPMKRPAAPETPVPKVSARPAPVAEPRPAQESKAVSPERQPSEAAAAAGNDMPSLRMESNASAWSKLSTGVKIGVAAALIAALGGIAYVVTRSGSGKSASEVTAAVQAPAAVATGVPISGGWIEDWANAAKSNRRISVLSGSLKLSDYRLELQAQIEAKSVGWVFRGLNPRNYYVAKLETIKPGLEPTVALVHFAVVDGHDENRVEVPLPMKVRVDTTYKIRFEAMGTHFSAWVQGQKIDEWTDSRFGSGGVGLFSDKDEHAALQGIVNVVPLVSRN